MEKNVDKNPVAVSKIIKEIEINNASSLIGSLESTEIIKNLFNDKFICAKNQIFDKITKKFIEKTKFDLTQFIEGNDYKTAEEINNDLDKIE